MNIQENDYNVETFNSGLRLRVKPQQKYDNWYFRGVLHKNDNQFLYRLGLSGNESEISPNKSIYIMPMEHYMVEIYVNYLDKA